MFRLFTLLTLFLFHLNAEDAFYSCSAKVKDSHSIAEKNLQIPLKKHQKLIFSKNIPNAKILKYDTFLSLYLVEDRKYFISPFKITKRYKKNLASFNNKSIIRGTIKRKQIGLNSFAVFSKTLSSPALLTSRCCSLEGIVTPKGIIEKEYLYRFVKSKESNYSDVGIRIEDINKSVVVVGVDPFFKGNLFKREDKLLSLNGKRVKSSAMFMKQILFSKCGTKQRVTLLRANKKISIEIVTQKRYGGGFVSDTFLERKGLFFNDALIINRVTKDAQKYGLKISDKLLQVDGIEVKNMQDIIKNVQSGKKFVSLLFERRGFQFFVQVN